LALCFHAQRAMFGRALWAKLSGEFRVRKVRHGVSQLARAMAKYRQAAQRGDQRPLPSGLLAR
jgi:hypothetical protein